ncbi:MAG TPA: sigma-54 dependent transcriptional regulator [Polyangia bacterium]|jgi:DNA-binding NtrC family response regulator|nr:sigma-54 dependent transcriptional regulator [Polyangia bacterium]
MKLSILLVDDDRAFSALASAALKREGFPVTVAHSLHEAQKAVDRAAFEMVVLDRRLPDGDGLDFLGPLKAALPAAVVVIVTAHGDIASAVGAIRAGAADYIVKPVELADLITKARRAADEVRLRERLSRAEGELSGRRQLIPPRSEAMRQVLAMLEQVARSPRSPVLLLGETGVGKEVLAWHVHVHGAGEPAPFVHVNCAALPDTTAESELFGHERGAFTDARTARHGLVESASGGTLLLDEVGELSAAVQAKLLTFLDSGQFRRLGGTTEQSSTARIIAATNRDLEADVRAGRFREDLWFRLGVFQVRVPPLRERREDLIVLAQGLLIRLQGELGRRNVRLSREAEARLLAYPFPGNVRELRNILERALVLEQGPELRLEMLATPASAAARPPEDQGDRFVVAGPPIPMEELERRYAQHVLQQLGGRRMEAAKALGLSYPTFVKRLGEE